MLMTKSKTSASSKKSGPISSAIKLLLNLMNDVSLDKSCKSVFSNATPLWMDVTEERIEDLTFLMFSSMYIGENRWYEKYMLSRKTREKEINKIKKVLNKMLILMFSSSNPNLILMNLLFFELIS